MTTQYPYPGATTVGIKGDNCVVLASEKRVSYGYFVISKEAKKVFQITDKIGAACAGMIGDMQILIRDAIAIINLYKLEIGREPSVQTVSKILSNHLFNSRFFPYLTETIIGGIDDEGAHIFVLDPLGSIIEDDYASVGSGAAIAIGIIEAEYKNNMKPKELYDLAIKAIKASISRDAASGNGIDILVFTSKGLEINETIKF